MRISDLSSDVCSSDLLLHRAPREQGKGLALRILAAIFGARHLHPLARHVDLVLGEQEADLGALGEGRKDEHRRDDADDERQAEAQEAHPPVVARPARRPPPAHRAVKVGAFGHSFSYSLKYSRTKPPPPRPRGAAPPHPA